VLPTVDDLKVVALRQFADERGVLAPVELTDVVPFTVVRLFWVRDVPPGIQRGAHAHVACHQFMICGAGSVAVDAFDGVAERTVTLAAGTAVHVPPALFTTERFADSRSVLMVLCDRPYEREDYLHDRASFVAHRQAILAAQGTSR
jgi:dTDP-4-dehydrorhamnose 3,5-epimerase-like enzyme